MRETKIQGDSYIGRGSSTIYVRPTLKQGVFWNDGKELHSLESCVDTSVTPFSSMMVLTSNNATAIVPEHFLSAVYWRDLSCEFSVRGPLPNYARVALGFDRNSHSFPVGNAKTFYDLLPKGTPLPEFEFIEPAFVNPTRETSLRVTPSDSFRARISWDDDRHYIRPKPVDTSSPVDFADAKGLYHASFFSPLAGILLPKVPMHYLPPKKIINTPGRNEHLMHTLGSDFPAELLCIVGGRVFGDFDLKHNNRGKGGGHRGRLDMLKHLKEIGKIRPVNGIRNLLYQK